MNNRISMCGVGFLQRRKRSGGCSGSIFILVCVWACTIAKAMSVREERERAQPPDRPCCGFFLQHAQRV